MGRTDHVSISPNSRWLAGANFTDNAITLWDLAARHPTVQPVILRQSDLMRSREFSPDGHWLASTSEDGTVHLCDLTARESSSEKIILRGHSKWAPNARFTPDGHWLITFGEHRTVRRWNLRLDELMATAREMARRELTPGERRQYLLPESTRSKTSGE